jgi:hypothetical protein
LDYPRLIAAFSEVLKTDQKADIKLTIVRFICRALLCAAPGQRSELLAVVDFPALLEFLEADTPDGQAVIVRACLAVLEGGKSCPFDVGAVIGSPSVVSVLGDIAQSGDDEASRLAQQLFDLTDGCN